MKRTAKLFVLALTLAFAMALAFGATAFAEPTPGQQVHLPILTWLGDEADACDVVIEVQNVGNDFTKAAILFWGAPGACPPQCNGPFKVECSGLLKPGSTWNFIGPDAPAQVPAGAKKGIVFSLDARQEGGDIVADAVCEALFADVRSDCDEYRRFKKSFDEDDGESWWGSPIAGQPLAVEVVRKCQAATMDAPVVSAYSGVSEWELGWYDPVFGGFTFYTPLLYADQDGLNSWIYIQNAGLECTSVEIWLKQQGECIRATIDEIPALAPGETIQYNVSDLMGPFWQGNAWIRTSVPVAIAVDNWSDEVLMTYVGRPAELNFTFAPGDEVTVGSQVNFGPLIYREHQGWNTNIQVQNLSSIVNAKVKVYFLDNSGDIIKTVVDWICPRGTQTFPLAVIDGLPGNWVGSVRVESQEWWTPGDPAVPPPNIISIAEMIRWDGPAQTVLLEGVAYNLFPEWQAYDWQVGAGWQFGVDLIGIPSFMNNMSGGGETGLTTELAIQNVVAKPGFTDFAIYIYDQNGLLDYVCEKLNEKQVEYINVADDWNYINDGFKGSAVISVTVWEHHGSFSPGLAAVKVERFNWPLVPSTDPADDFPGDQASASEGFPIQGSFDYEGPGTPVCPGQPGPCTFTLYGTVLDARDLTPINGALVVAFTEAEGVQVTALTDSTGNFAMDIPAGQGQTFVAAGATGYTTSALAVVPPVECSGSFLLDFELDPTFPCTGDIEGQVTADTTELGAIPIPGATVTVVDSQGATFTATTDETGHYQVFGVAGGAATVTASADNFVAETLAVDVVCDQDNEANFQLNLVDPSAAILGTVEDKETGEPIAGATVTAANCVTSNSAQTAADGSYLVTLASGDEVCATIVQAAIAGYNPQWETFQLGGGDFAIQDFQLKQTPASRILIYRGNGGEVDLPLAGFTTLAQNLNYIVDDTTDWPDGDLLEYKAIFLVGPGVQNDAVPGPNVFTIGQIAALQQWVNTPRPDGTLRRLVLLGGGGGVPVVDTDPATAAFSDAVANKLLKDMSLSDTDTVNTLTFGIEFSFDAGDQNVPDSIADQFPNVTQATDGVPGGVFPIGTLHLDTSHILNVAAPAIRLADLNFSHATNPGETVVAATVVPGSPGTPGNGADVIVTADSDWLSDLLVCGFSATDCFTTANNSQFATNLLLGY